MKTKPIYWIALALSLALIVAMCDGRRSGNTYSVAMKIEKDANKKSNAEKDKIINASQKVITQQTAKIAELLSNAGKPSVSEIAKDKTIAEQQRKIVAFEEQGDLAGALTASKAESRAWAEKFTLAEGRHKTAIFDLNAAWTVKYEAQVGISQAWKAKYESELHLRTLAEKGWKASERKLKWTRVVSNVKTGLILAAFAAVGYEELRGK